MFHFFKKNNSKYTYIVDLNTFYLYLQRSIQFSKENKLEAVTDFKIYYQDKAHPVNIWDFTQSDSQEERSKGLSVMLDNVEYQTIENLLQNGFLENKKIQDFEYLKIELTYSDDVFLNEYRKNHPELTEEFYQQITAS